jgi:flagellar hook-basal body complex protein FliE
MALESIQDFTGRGESGSRTLNIPGSGTVPAGSPGKLREGGQAERGSFGDLVKEFTADVNNLQFEAGHAIDQMVTGEAADVHQVMVAVEQAGIALDLMLEVRNRVMEGYQELIRMQV